MEIAKEIKNKGLQSELYYWKINKGIEIDIILDNWQSLMPIEVKSAQTFSTDFEKNLTAFNSARKENGGMIVYDGKMDFISSKQIEVFNWKDLMEKLGSVI
jgi:predicted AAA+ superfamily ATPase